MGTSESLTPASSRAGDLLRFSTAGSVDDGKSTLIGRLLHDSRGIFEDQLDHIRDHSAKRGRDGLDLSLLTDGLKAEREQGITIDVAYRYFSTPRRSFIIADTPGHEQYTRNMVTGASTADAAVVLIDGRNGLVTQSKRHACIAHLLGIRHILVAINKMDLVGYSQSCFEDVRAQVELWARRLPEARFAFVPISAKVGDHVVERGAAMPWYQGPTLLEWLEALPGVLDLAEGPLRMPVQQVVRPPGEAWHDFRGYFGRIESGTVRVGQEVRVEPQGHVARIERIHRWGGDRDVAVAPESVCLCLDRDLDIARGDLFAAPEDPPRVTADLRATVAWMGAEPMRAGGRYLLKHGTRTVRAIVRSLHHKIRVEDLEEDRSAVALVTNDLGVISLRAQQALPIDPYVRSRATGAFILMDEHTNNTVGAGMITDETRAG